ncbi:MAG: metalloregulator ArsR/SmtB family transcription factor [Lawsonella sp.]
MSEHEVEHCQKSNREDLAPLPPKRLLEATGRLLQSMTAPARIAIIVQLQTRPCCVHELVDSLNMPQPAVSQHLKVLKNAGVVTVTRRGREHIYKLSDQHLSAIVNDAMSHAEEILANKFAE